MNQDSWQALSRLLVSLLHQDEAINLSLVAENTLYARITKSKIRQIFEVQQGLVTIHFFKDKRHLVLTLPYTGNFDHDALKFQYALAQCRLDLEGAQPDPLIQLPSFQASYHHSPKHKLPRLDLLDQCMTTIQNKDFVGLFTAGEMIRANFNSMGLDQWFESSTFAVDFSLYTSTQQAVKGVYGGSNWDTEQFAQLLTEKHRQLRYFETPLKTIDQGKYRVYLAPEAVQNLLDLIGSSSGVSQDAYQRGQCALKKFVDGKVSLSQQITLQENFTSGEIPPFNDQGEIGHSIVPLIKEGRHQSLLCSSRTAHAYHTPSNFANSQETMRAPELLSGQLSHQRISKELGTGLYVANLHYLNWSDLQEGRITGMTRFGCFWVEGGEIQHPIHDMRFDESLYHFWGSGLEGLTDTLYIFPNLDTYYQRNVGAMKIPGMLVNDFTFVS